MDGIEPRALRGPFFCAALAAIRADRRTRRAQGAGAQDMQAINWLAGAQTSIDIYRLAGAQTYRPAGRLAGAQTGTLESRGLDACTGLLFPI